MLIYAILLNVGVMVLRIALEDTWGIAAPLAFFGVVLAIAALLLLASGLGYSRGKTALLVVLAFVPLASLVMLAMVNARATEALRAGGYRVGLFGASRGPTRAG